MLADLLLTLVLLLQLCWVCWLVAGFVDISQQEKKP